MVQVCLLLLRLGLEDDLAVREGSFRALRELASGSIVLTGETVAVNQVVGDVNVEAAVQGRSRCREVRHRFLRRLRLRSWSRTAPLPDDVR